MNTSKETTPAADEKEALTMEVVGSVSSLQDGPQWGRGPHYGSFAESLVSLTPRAAERPPTSRKRAYLAVAVLCYINLLNYMERYMIADVLPNIQEFFGVNDGMVALLQTVLVISFILLAPLFGYLGDRYNRKYIMICGLSMWIVTAVSSSFVTKSHFWFLMLMRAIVGIGEASFTILAPTIIADLFAGAQRSVMIGAFYIFISIGSGLGFIAGSSVTNLTGDWRWALRVTPILGFVGVILLAFTCPNPTRGAAEMRRERTEEKSSYLDDVKYLLKNKSYIWSTLGLVALTFNLGALAFWFPTFLTRSRVFLGLQPPCTKQSCMANDSSTLGAVMIVSGVLGGCVGTMLSRQFRDKVPYADPLICAVGLLGLVPCLLAAIFVASTSITITYVFVTLALLLVSVNWAVMADMLLYVIIPNRRSTAEALQITISHLLGDSGSPYLVGVISDTVRNTHPQTPEWSFRSLQYSLVLCPVVGFFGGLSYLLCVRYISEDRKAVVCYTEEDGSPQLGPESESSVIRSDQEKEKE